MLSNKFVAEMVRAGFSNEDIRKALHCFDVVLEDYNVSPKEANITLYNGQNINNYYFETYMACREFQGYAKGTLKNIKLWLGKFIDYLSCSVIDVTPMQIRLFLHSHRLSRKGTEIKATSMEKIKQVLSSFYNWLIEERQLSVNPAKSVQQMRMPTPYKGCLQQEELERLKYACKNLREQTIIEVCASTGCRIAELTGINLDDIDMRERSIKVTGKGNKERIVYFSAEAKLLIENYLRSRKKKCNWLFESRYGNKPIGTDRMRSIMENVFSRVKDIVSLKHFTPHTLRRTFATLALKKGMTLEQVSRLLGHSNIQTTTRYIKFDQDELQMQHSRLVG